MDASTYNFIFLKKLLDKVGVYDEKLKISSDYDFMIRLLKTKDIKIFFR